MRVIQSWGDELQPLLSGRLRVAVVCKLLVNFLGMMESYSES